MRQKPAQTVYLRVLTPTVPVTLEPYGLKDISEDGLGLYSPHYFEPGSVHRIEICTDETGWIGYMRVVYCLSSNSKYIVGLEKVDKDGNKPTESAVRVAPQLTYNDPYELVASPQKQWLEQTRHQISETFRAYSRARHTFGFLGKRIDDVVSQYLATLPDTATDRGNIGRRKDIRKRTNTKAHLILVGPNHWYGMKVHVINVSRTGAGVVMPMEALQALPERLQNDLLGDHCSEEAIFGLSSSDELLWLPALVVHLHPDDDERLCFGGLRFEKKPFEIPDV